MIRRRPAAGGRIPLLISYCRNINTRLRSVSERMWRNHMKKMYKNFSFIVTLPQGCGVIYKTDCCLLCKFASFHRGHRGGHSIFPALFLRTNAQKSPQNVVKMKKLSACAPAFSEILFENVDYLTRKCATYPRHILYTESTNHPEHPCAALRPEYTAESRCVGYIFNIVQEAIT